VLTFQSKKVVAIGEAMIEMAVTGPDTYRRSFAGDTFNTAWYMSQLLRNIGTVGFVSYVGDDTVSNAFVQQIGADGLVTTGIGIDPHRSMGLYMIELQDTERQFHYWRSRSAARLLADDPNWLMASIRDASLIHLSGITLAILSKIARDTLFKCIETARQNGARVSFDPNVRPKLWSSLEEARTSSARFLTVTDIAFPSFDDETLLWGDVTPHATQERLSRLGVTEIVVKNGAAAVAARSSDTSISVETPIVEDIKDTSGAGDGFNAGYLVGRLMGQPQADAIAIGQTISSEVIRHFGARIPKACIPELPCQLQSREQV
jgi:2-dehydro-3-deoxygluconokinase